MGELLLFLRKDKEPIVLHKYTDYKIIIFTNLEWLTAGYRISITDYNLLIEMVLPASFPIKYRI